MLRNKAKMEIVSRILGHSSVAITLDVYRHIYDEEVLEEVELHGPTSDGQLALERALRHKDILKT
jgi:integrase